ncbi:MAG: response regulator, partial [Chromatiaceae bacterium]|nr:response regulator [Chromatiaceae bacterium]
MSKTEDKERILIVDDTPDNIDLLVGVLQDDYEMMAAINGERALKVARSAAKPDMILLDIMMPGMDGYEVCRQLKADPATSDIPVIFITA